MFSFYFFSPYNSSFDSTYKKYGHVNETTLILLFYWTLPCDVSDTVFGISVVCLCRPHVRRGYDVPNSVSVLLSFEIPQESKMA